MTPTYPVLDSSYINGVVVAKMKLFNRRNDVEYYQIEVFTKDWKPINFVNLNSKYIIRRLFIKLVKLNYAK
jgi:hypothetical protein